MYCAVLVASWPIAARADKAPDLLLPADAATTKRLSDPAYAGLRKQLYFAKQYRIVTIDWSLLEKPDAVFRIELFDGASIDVQATDVATSVSNDYVRHWRGETAGPLSSLRDLELSIRMNTLEVSPLLQKQLATERSVPALMSSRPPGARDSSGGQRAIAKIAVPTARGRWIVPALKAQFVLMVIEDDPRYHVLYSEDPAKLPVGANAQARRAAFTRFSAQVDVDARQLAKSAP
jgi:hypothetical protein